MQRKENIEKYSKMFEMENKLGILINPYMYKLLGMPYDNYKKSV